jgi:hypothetical protein
MLQSALMRPFTLQQYHQQARVGCEGLAFEASLDPVCLAFHGVLMSSPVMSQCDAGTRRSAADPSHC